MSYLSNTSEKVYAQSAVQNTTAPTFAGVATVAANSDGSVTVTWATATGTAPTPIRYKVYIALGASVAPATLFVGANVAEEGVSTWTKANIFQLGDQATYLVNGSTYTVGVRAYSAENVSETNTVTLNITATGYNYSALIANIAAVPAAVWNSLAASYTSAGTFGKNLDAQISLTQTAAEATTQYNAITTTLGTPAGASMSADIAQVETHASSVDTKLGTPATTVSGDIAAVQTKLGTPAGASVSADIAQIETHAASSDSKLGTPATTVSGDIAAIETKLGTPAGASVSADIALVESQTLGLRTDYTTDRAVKLDNLDTNVESRATQSSVNAIPTTPQLASVALTQYNAIETSIGAIQNNVNFTGVVPSYMDEQFGVETETYTFYSQVYNTVGEPIDPDSNIITVTVKDQQGNVLLAPTTATRDDAGQYQTYFTVTAAMGAADIVVTFSYSVASQAYTQIRTSKILSTETDSANITAILGYTQNLPADPASNTVVNTRASQSSVNAIPTNPLLTNDSRLNNLDTTISSREPSSDPRLANLDVTVSSRATQASVDEIPMNPLETNDARLNYLDVAISSREPSSDPRLANLDAPISAVATATQLDAAVAPLATSADISGLAQAQYVNRITTVYRNLTQDQEILVWAERDGQRRTDGTNCSIAVFGSQQQAVWSGSASSPSSDGIFRFVNAVAATSDQNFYVVITITTDGEPHTNQQPFFTVG